MVGQHHHRLAVGWHLDRAATRPSLGSSSVTRRRSGDARPGAARPGSTRLDGPRRRREPAEARRRRTSRPAGPGHTRTRSGRGRRRRDVDRDRGRRVVADRQHGRRGRSAPGRARQRVVRRATRAPASTVDPAAHGEVRPRPFAVDRDRQVVARRQRRAAPARTVVATRTGPVARTTSPPAVSSTAASLVLPTSRLTSAASARVDRARRSARRGGRDPGGRGPGPSSTTRRRRPRSTPQLVMRDRRT